MAIEIERKFLLRDESWRASVSRSTRLRQGYLTSEKHCSVRVRTSADAAWLNIKSITIGVERQEFEYPIPLSDADTLLDTLSQKPLIEKTRYYVEVGHHTWEIDVFAGDNLGLVVAEIELNAADEAFEKPAWVGEEVTEEVRYYNTQLARHPYSEWSSE